MILLTITAIFLSDSPSIPQIGICVGISRRRHQIDDFSPDELRFLPPIELQFLLQKYRKSILAAALASCWFRSTQTHRQLVAILIADIPPNQTIYVKNLNEELKKEGNSSINMKAKIVWRKVRDYVRYDLKEIAFPSSLPDPPHFKKRRKLTWKERYLVLKEATRLYAASWVRDIGPELRPNEYKKKENSGDGPDGVTGSTGEREPSTLEDLAVAARGGMETLRPALQRVYMTRASAYRDALTSFVQGYQEGIQEVMEKKNNSQPHQENNAMEKKDNSEPLQENNVMEKKDIS
ncbi:hypothetical protein L6452_14857 [Arctium lappa]|uniref:Uncharacterized protein n=1 Tax=Arctium lappa TaxID=4217 RepID=A0ACB9CM63_ARCLA|nr:hypothetical protein L6452_14857 [Arctium lappa]